MRSRRERRDRRDGSGPGRIHPTPPVVSRRTLPASTRRPAPGGEEAPSGPFPTPEAAEEADPETATNRPSWPRPNGGTDPGSSWHRLESRPARSDLATYYRSIHVFQPRGTIRDRNARLAPNPTSPKAPPARGTGHGTPPVRANDGEESDAVDASVPDPSSTDP